jgi:hypothetical protein
LRTALIGLPQLSASSAAKAVGLRLDPVGDLQEIAGAFAGVVRDQVSNAFSAAATARSTWIDGGFGQVQDRGSPGARVEDGFFMFRPALEVGPDQHLSVHESTSVLLVICRGRRSGRRRG